jgi:uncharacterized membrane protein YedE/YeeE
VSSNILKGTITSFIVGFIFAVGLALAGMTQAQKIISFLNPWEWDPSLMFVMVGAIGVHIITYPLIRKRATPFFDVKWHVPTRSDITPRLIVGSALFGIGWGVGGFCPGPAITSLTSGDLRSLYFVIAMLVGMFVYKKTDRFLKF